ncbi:uncharacterized protein LOC110410850 [Herrania umbratica]|uniref:Uncharacterized protein LOC110410850 n=1 Tax=Herrania umbratica TaxID=108875 RepID=A0A6J0ZNM2_9ROSI|nr:uncharacterized protein LOC110410850 [Herrania umbratica]
MLLRNSISNTKKFFQKTLQSFRSLFSGGGGSVDYQKLPKASPYNPSSFSTTAGLDMNGPTSYQQDLEKFYTDFTDRWESDKGKEKKRNKKKIVSTPTEQPKEGDKGGFTQFTRTSPTKKNTTQTREDNDDQSTTTRSAKVEKRLEDTYMKSKREARSLSVAQKLKGLEMMDRSNMDHVLDIEEVLHYYSRLTCPAYLDIVDKFFMDICTEFSGPAASPKSVNSRSKFRSLLDKFKTPNLDLNNLKLGKGCAALKILESLAMLESVDSRPILFSNQPG